MTERHMYLQKDGQRNTLTWTEVQTDRQVDKYRQINTRPDKQIDKQTDKQADKQTDKNDKPVGRHVNWQPDRQTEALAKRQQSIERQSGTSPA